MPGVGERLKKFHEKDLMHTKMAKGQVSAYCKDCRRQVTPKGVSPWIMLSLVILGIILIPVLIGILLLFVALAYYMKYYRHGGRCPICNGRNLSYQK